MMASILNSNLVCTSCEKDGSDAYVKCLFCNKLFHAIGCNVDSDICNKTFLDSFSKFEGKTGSYANRPGIFKFVCDSCITKFEVEKISTTNDKVESINNKVSDLEKSISDLTLLIKQNKPDFSDKKRHYVTYANVTKPPSPIKVPSENSLLVIPSDSDENLNSEIEKTVFDSSIKINKSFTNKSGDRVLVCDSVDDRNLLKTTLSGKLPNLQTRTPNAFRPTIVVVGYSEFFVEDVRKNIVHQNPNLQDFFSLNNIDEHFNFVSSSSLKNRPDLHQSVFSVSKQFRLFLQNCGDKVVLGFRYCKIFDRLFIRRCFKCQKFGHTSSDCNKTACCSRCSGTHDVRDCQITQTDNHKHACINCKLANKPFSHTSSSLLCNSYLEEKNRVQDKLFNLN